MQSHLGRLKAARAFLSELKPLLVEIFVLLASIILMVKALKLELLDLS